MKSKDFYNEETVKVPVAAVTHPLGYSREDLNKIVTAPIPAIPGRLSRGADTCDKLDLILKYSGAYSFVYILGVGFVRVRGVRQLNRHYMRVETIDPIGHIAYYDLHWYAEMHTFLGEP